MKYKLIAVEAGLLLTSITLAAGGILAGIGA